MTGVWENKQGLVCPCLDVVVDCDRAPVLSGHYLLNVASEIEEVLFALPQRLVRKGVEFRVKVLGDVGVGVATVRRRNGTIGVRSRTVAVFLLPLPVTKQINTTLNATLRATHANTHLTPRYVTLRKFTQVRIG